ncbi:MULTISPECIES: hypothetical protein [unclassified Legionella]|uniref:hypothetical protein n=1 Tax=unclassified Legionella TaxID=2622702 RepID=UPI00105615A2|nr:MULTISPECIES: hypothetical protein [unclassified Legionella]MDI9818359.1 hypothetical protein [Legionella sp. PL877]
MGLKLVVWDVDGPINHGKSKSNDDCYMPSTRSEFSRKGEDPVDFVVANKPFVKLTLEVLHKNGIVSVIGSQRIQMKDNDENYGKFIQSMYQGLDYIFGKKRPYLKEEVARKIGAGLPNEETNKSKNKLLKAYQDEFKVKPEDIIFIDDHDNYRASTEAAGHVFIHAPRKAKPDTVEDNSYLYEALLRTIPANKIYKALESSKDNSVVKNDFKKQLLLFQLDNLKEVTTWQQKIIVKDDRFKKNDPIGQEKPIKEYDEYKTILKEEPEWSTRHAERIDKLTKQVKASRSVLQGIQYLIFDTKWDIGLLGGVSITDQTTGQKNTVPKGMNEILQQIDKAQRGKISWDDALKNVDKIVNESAGRKDHGPFNKRGETTQLFYDKAKQMLSDLREKEESASKENDNPLKP